MTSCGMEAINALWSALAFGVPTSAMSTVVFMCWRAENKDGADGGHAGPAVFAIIVAATMSIGVHMHGQTSLRYWYAASAGHECQYDSGGKITIIRGSN